MEIERRAYVQAALILAVLALIPVSDGGRRLYRAFHVKPETVPAAPVKLRREVPGDMQLVRLFSGGVSPTPAAALSPESWISDTYGIILKGTVPGAAAVIEDISSGEERLVHPGEDTGSFTVRDITRNRLVIQGERGMETLSLPADARNLQPTPFRRLRVLNRRELDALVRNVDRFASEAAMKPVRAATGGIAGYRITRLKAGGILYRMGLRKDDIIGTVNGGTPSSPEDIYRVFESAIHENRLVLTIRRQQRVYRYRYQIQ